MLMGKEGGFLHGKMKVFSVNGIDIIWRYMEVLHDRKIQMNDMGMSYQQPSGKLLTKKYGKPSL